MLCKNNSVTLNIGDYIYIYKPLNLDYKTNYSQEFEIKKVICVIADIKCYSCTRNIKKIHLIFPETHGHYAYVNSDRINLSIEEYQMGDSYYCTIENDDFFKTVFFKQKIDSLIDYHKRIAQHEEQCIREKQEVHDQYKKEHTIYLKQKVSENGIESILSKVHIKFDRYNDNKNTKTFDMIEACVPFIGFSSYKYTKREIIDFITPYKKIIIKHILDSINNSKRFQKYNIPINFLKIYRITVTNDLCLIVNFALKEV